MVKPMTTRRKARHETLTAALAAGMILATTGAAVAGAPAQAAPLAPPQKTVPAATGTPDAASARPPAVPAPVSHAHIEVALSSVDRDAIGRVSYAEAGNQAEEGLAGVIFTILNRLHTGQWGGSVTAVVNAPGQFEPVMRAGGDWRNLPPLTPAQVVEFNTILDLILQGRVPDPTNGALYFQNPAIVAARAAAGQVSPSLVNFGGEKPIAVIRDHSFYAAIADGAGAGAAQAGRGSPFAPPPPPPLFSDGASPGLFSPLTGQAATPPGLFVPVATAAPTVPSGGATKGPSGKGKGGTLLRPLVATSGPPGLFVPVTVATVQPEPGPAAPSPGAIDAAPPRRGTRGTAEVRAEVRNAGGGVTGQPLAAPPTSGAKVATPGQDKAFDPTLAAQALDETEKPAAPAHPASNGLAQTRPLGVENPGQGTQPSPATLTAQAQGG